jgi:hypothetical protein
VHSAANGRSEPFPTGDAARKRRSTTKKLTSSCNKAVQFAPLTRRLFCADFDEKGGLLKIGHEN